jgi:purine-binding chemotaxis protein CheW
MTTMTITPETFRTPNAEVQSYATFRLRDEWFGVPTDVVKEVTLVPPLTPVPHAPQAVRGYVNLRGHIVLVVDLNYLLYRSPAELDADTRLIVFKPQLGDAWSILVQHIGDMVVLGAEHLESYRTGSDADSQDAGLLPQEELIRGVGKLDKQLLLILDPRRLPSCLEQMIAKRCQQPFSHRNASKENCL